MPQSPISTAVALLNGVAKLLTLDPSSLLATTNGGLKSALNQSAAAAIKATPGRLARITVVTAPSAGNLTVNDCATTGAAATANQIVSVAFGSLTAGQVIPLDWPCAVGIVLSSVGTGGVFALSYT